MLPEGHETDLDGTARPAICGAPGRAAPRGSKPVPTPVSVSALGSPSTNRVEHQSLTTPRADFRRYALREGEFAFQDLRGVSFRRVVGKVIHFHRPSIAGRGIIKIESHDPTSI